MMQKLRQLCGIIKQESSEGVGFDYAAFMAERENCSRNSAIAYFMRECGVIPSADSVEVMGFWFATYQVFKTYQITEP